MPILESHAVEINKPENHKLDVVKVNFNLNNKIENEDEEDMIKGKVAKKAEPIVKSRNKAVGLEDKFAHNTHSGSNQETANKERFRKEILSRIPLHRNILLIKRKSRSLDDTEELHLPKLENKSRNIIGIKNKAAK